MTRRQIIHLKTDPRRVYVFDRHLHHGLDGVVLLFISLILIWTDRRDFPWAFAKDPEPGV
jgi:hypothetical protein